MPIEIQLKICIFSLFQDKLIEKIKVIQNKQKIVII
jgi:hypothetical protein